MGILDSITGGAVSGILSSVGSVAKDIRESITGVDVQKEYEIKLKLMELETAALQAQSQVVIAEAKGESWMQRNWRPLIMLMIGAIIGYNYLIVPFLRLVWETPVILELPDGLWNLMTLGLSGYIVGRSAEKVLKK